MGEDHPPKKGTAFLGNPRNLKAAGYDSQGGNVDYDPEYECTGGSTDPADRRCPHRLRDADAMTLPLTGWDGRLLHMNMPSFRDPLCPRTLKNLFTKAKRPFDIRVRVLQQNVPGEDVGCLEEYCAMMARLRAETGGGDTSQGGPAGDDCPHEEQIFIHPIHARDAAGPTYARGLLGQDIREAYEKDLISPQDFCMSTDSHMDYEPEWDQKMVEMWDMAENEYAVLSTYVADIAQLGVNLNGKHEVPHLCMVMFTSQVRTTATKMAQNLPRPKLTNAIWGAGLSFSKCHAELKVPVDPHTPGVFDGEEFNRAARFWTIRLILMYVLHDYPGSQHNPKTTGWGHGSFSPAEVANGHYRLNTMLDIPGGEENHEKALQLKRSKYGLGDRRTLDDLIQFSGIDLRHRKATIDGKNRCGNLQWVPFTESPKGVNYIPKFDESTEDPLDVPYEKTSVWYDPQVDGAGAGLVPRQVDDAEKDALPSAAQSAEEQRAEEAAHDAHKKEAHQLAGGSLHEHHQALAAALKAEEGATDGGSTEGGHGEGISRAAAASLKAALKAEQVEKDGVHIFPPLLRGAPGIPKGRFSLSSVTLKRHGVEHLPVQVKVAVFIMVLGIFSAIIASGGKKERRSNRKKFG